MKTYVIDASVIVRSYLQKDSVADKRLAKCLREAGRGTTKLYSSTLLDLEVGNALRYNANLKDLKSFFDRLAKVPITRYCFTVTQVAEITFQAITLKTTVYDTSYHYLANLMSGEFLTCDKEYYQAAKEFGHIELLS